MLANTREQFEQVKGAVVKMTQAILHTVRSVRVKLSGGFSCWWHGGSPLFCKTVSVVVAKTSKSLNFWLRPPPATVIFPAGSQISRTAEAGGGGRRRQITQRKTRGSGRVPLPAADG